MGKRGSRNDLTSLSRDLRRSRAQAARLWRIYQAIDEHLDPSASTLAHGAWSAAVDDTLKIVDAISRKQATSVDEVVVQFDAIWWWVVEDDGILDSAARRWLRRFRRSLRGLAAKS